MPAIIHAIRGGELDRLEIPRNALDILAQQIVARLLGEAWNEDDLSICFAKPILTAICSAAILMPLSRCFQKVSRLRAAAVERSCIATR